MASLEKTLVSLAKTTRCPGRSVALRFQRRFSQSSSLMKIPADAWVLLFRMLQLHLLEGFDAESFRPAAQTIFGGAQTPAQHQAKVIPMSIRQLDDKEVQMLLLSVRCAQLAGLEPDEVLYQSWWVPANLAIYLARAKSRSKAMVGASQGRPNRFPSTKRIRRPSEMGLRQVSGTQSEVVVIDNKLVLKTTRVG